MAVPAHDERDFEFAKKYSLPVKDVVIPLRIDKVNPPIAGKKVVERKTIHAVIRNPKSNKILCLKWKKHPWTGFIVGGVDDGEDIVKAAKREVREETGYKNLKFIKTSGAPTRGEYFAAHKDENRVAYSTAVYFELIDEERDDITNEESEKYEIVWLTEEEIQKGPFTCAEVDVWFKRLFGKENAYTENGVLMNSGKFDGIENKKAGEEITKEFGKKAITYKIKDWVFSRQRYWGEPIPLIHCEKCGVVSIPEKDLPVTLPEVKHYEPTGTGESPLANISEWVNVKCPKCGGSAKRETNTMPQWAGSCWYHLRYMDPHNDEAFVDPTKEKYWAPVDMYVGGTEHATRHLIYSRFWHKFLFDIGVVSTSEPFSHLKNQGLIMGNDGRKMSKRFGNVINPDDIVRDFGADSLRVYIAFMG
ncbi:MAG: class I tRNA ligase family protein, partial [Patescibacteria group bacterium]